MAITKAQVKAWNDKFKSLTKAEQRVEIAKDVLKQIKAGKYAPLREGYGDLSILSDNVDIQSNFDKINNCQCCNLGSCLLSITKFKNNLTVEDFHSGFATRDSKVSKMLKSIFTPYQQALIEGAFENGGFGHADNAYGVSLTWKDKQKCWDFYDKYSTSQQRTIATMKNIIANNGTFRP